MKTEFTATRVSRQIYNSFFEKYSIEQLNKVPEGFSNNLIWNIAHVVVAQQMLLYSGSGNQPMISQEMMNLYMRGTKPERDVTGKEADEIQNLLFSTIEKSEEDYRNGLFKSYTERQTQLGFILKNIEDAIVFNNYHEGVHLGIMMGIRKFL